MSQRRNGYRSTTAPNSYTSICGLPQRMRNSILRLNRTRSSSIRLRSFPMRPAQNHPRNPPKKAHRLAPLPPRRALSRPPAPPVLRHQLRHRQIRRHHRSPRQLHHLPAHPRQQRRIALERLRRIPHRQSFRCRLLIQVSPLPLPCLAGLTLKVFSLLVPPLPHPQRDGDRFSLCRPARRR